MNKPSRNDDCRKWTGSGYGGDPSGGHLWFVLGVMTLLIFSVCAGIGATMILYVLFHA